MVSKPSPIVKFGLNTTLSQSKAYTVVIIIFFYFWGLKTLESLLVFKCFLGKVSSIELPVLDMFFL